MALSKIERGHEMYRCGQEEEALQLYTEALSMAKTKPQKIALHSNRAACYLKLHDFKKAAEECTLVLELDHNHTGALMLRAQTLVTLKEYNSALFDVSRLMELNPSSDVYQSLQARLKTQLSLAPILECEEELLVSEFCEEVIADRKTEAETILPNPVDSVAQVQTFEDSSNLQTQDWKAIPKLEVHFKAPSLADQNTEAIGTTLKSEASASQKQSLKEFANIDSIGWDTIAKPKDHSKPMEDQKAKAQGTIPKFGAPASQRQTSKDFVDVHSNGWEAIPKPKGHSNLDYSRWNRVEEDSSEEDEDEEESLPRYRFRVKTVGVRPVK